MENTTQVALYAASESKPAALFTESDCEQVREFYATVAYRKACFADWSLELDAKAALVGEPEVCKCGGGESCPRSKGGN